MIYEKYDSCYKFSKEILKIITKENFDFDEDTPKTLIIYYYLTSGLFSLLCNSDLNQEGIDLEISIYYIINAYLTTIIQNLQSTQKLNCLLMKIVSMIIRIFKSNENNLVLRFENNNLQQLVCNIEIIIKKIKEILAIYDKTNSFINEEMIFFKNIEEFFEGLGIKTNFVLTNIERFSQDSMREPIKETVNESFVLKFISDKYLNVLANLIVDEIDYKNYFDKKVTLESFNGFLIIDKDEITLYAVQSFFKMNESNENIINFNNKKLKKTSSDFIFNIFEIKSHNEYSSFYTKTKFRIFKDEKLDPIIIIIIIATLYKCKAYRAVIPLLIFLTNEFEKNMTSLNERENKPYLLLYEFLIFVEIYLLFILEDFTLALIQLDKLKTQSCEFTNIYSKILLGVCISKHKFSDLSILYFDTIINKITPNISNEELLPQIKSDEKEGNKTLQSIGTNNGNKENNYKKIIFNDEKLPESNY